MTHKLHWLSLCLSCCAAQARPAPAPTTAGVPDADQAGIANDATDAKPGTTLPDTGSKGEVSLAGAATEGDDLAAMELIAIARKGSAVAAGAYFPQDPASLWPGYHLHNLPIVLVPTTAAGKPLRAYLLGYPALPTAAIAVPGHPEAARYDPAIKELNSDEAATIAGHDAMTIRLVHDDLAVPDHFMALVAGQAMSRLMHYEAAWDPPGACGANEYPRGELTLALWFLECAVLAEALTASDAPTLQTRLREVFAIRSAYGGLTEMLARMNTHYDNAFAPVALVGLRVLRNTGRLGAKGYAVRLKAWIDAPMTVPVDQFDASFVNDGTVRAVALELAYRLGWDLPPTYAKAGTALGMVPANTGGEPEPALVDQAKARHDWQKMLVRAKALTPALP